MWIQRSPDEVKKWQSDNEKQARFNGLMIGVMGWAVAVVVASAGWVVCFQSGMAAQPVFAGTFWTRLPVFALLGSPIIFIARRIEGRKALKKNERLTVCPGCDKAGDGNAGAACECGGTFVSMSTMKWIEKR